MTFSVFPLQHAQSDLLISNQQTHPVVGWRHIYSLTYWTFIPFPVLVYLVNILVLRERRRGSEMRSTTRERESSLMVSWGHTGE